MPSPPFLATALGGMDPSMRIGMELTNQRLTYMLSHLKDPNTQEKSEEMEIEKQAT